MRITSIIGAGVMSALLLCAAPALAQDGRQCPKLPNNSTLKWQEMRNPDLLFCKALDGNGEQAFSVMVARESPFNPTRSLRSESSRINGQDTWWYRTAIANRPELVVREAAITLPDGNIAYFNVQAASQDRLQDSFGVISGLGF